MIITNDINEGEIINVEMAAAAALRRDPAHDEFVCSVCHEYFEVPVKTRCNHLFCKDCLLQALAVNEACPFCRNALTKSQYSVAQRVDEKMRTTSLSCKNCNEQFKPIDGRVHDARCVDRVVPQPQLIRSAGLGVTVNRFVFPCAYCQAPNFSREGLIAHCNANHKQAPNHKLVCTICVAFPWGENNKVSGNLLEHLNLRHQFDYDRFVDLQEDEEASLNAALQASYM